MTGSDFHSQRSNHVFVQVVHRVWNQLTQPAAAIQGAEPRRRARLIASMLTVVIGLFVLNDAINFLNNPDYTLPPSNIVGYTVLLAAYILSRTRYSHLAAMLTVGMFVSISFEQAITTGNPALKLTFMVPSLLMLSIWLSVRGTALVTLAIFAGMLLLPVVAPAQIPSLGSIDAALGINGMTSVLLLVVMIHRNQVENDRLAKLKRAKEEAQRRAAQAALIYEVSQRVSGELELDELLSAIVTTVYDAFDYYGVMLLLLDEEAECLTMQSIAGGYVGIFPEDFRLVIGEGMIGRAAATSETQISNDVSKAPRYMRKAKEKTKSELAVPIESGQKVIGVLDLQSDKIDAFDETDVTLIETLSSSIAVAIENSHLYETVRQELAEREQAEKERDRLQQEIIEAQKRALQELSTPIIPVMNRIIVMPLIGSIDAIRARDITRALLTGIRKHRARVVILDITGVPVVDIGVASYLHKTIQAARLKGAQTIVTGVSDAVAESIVDLGIDWSGIETLSDLQTGLVLALKRLGVILTR